MRRATILAMVLALTVLPLAPAGANPERAESTPVSGATWFTSMTPGEVRVTPSGVMHEYGAVATLAFAGDIAGTETCSYSQSTMSATGDSLISQCAAVGEYTWNGRTGPARGVITAHCTAEVPYAFTCSGNRVMHGSGALDGVTFRITWSGSGFGPFSYSGVVLDTHG